MMPAAALPDTALVAHIVEHHHAYARRALPYIVPLLSKITGFHRQRNRKLAALCEAGHELADTLEAHLDGEESALFPELLAGAPRRDVVRRELDQMQHQHRQLELLLSRIRWLADDYAAPGWAGRSYQALMEELEGLEENLREHLELESSILAPRLSSRFAEPSGQPS
jgi:regulator of cell morphogenesis and NO signaling